MATRFLIATLTLLSYLIGIVADAGLLHALHDLFADEEIIFCCPGGGCMCTAEDDMDGNCCCGMEEPDAPTEPRFVGCGPDLPEPVPLRQLDKHLFAKPMIPEAWPEVVSFVAFKLKAVPSREPDTPDKIPIIPA